MRKQERAAAIIKKAQPTVPSNLIATKHLCLLGATRRYMRA